jgi:hypothetical protein
MLIDNHQPDATDTERRTQQMPTEPDQRLTISVEETGRLLGISRGLAYELVNEASFQASGSAVASSSHVVRSIACSTCRTTRPESDPPVCGRTAGSAHWRPAETARSRPPRHAACW